MFDTLVVIAGFVGGAIASVTGIGIASVLTPFLALTVGMRVAVAAVSIPHLAATVIRFWMLRRHLDISVLIHFGILSAAGGLAGAMLQSATADRLLMVVFAILLLLAGASGLSGHATKMRFGPRTAWIAGAASGVFGGLVGNQGGIRSAAMLGFGLRPHAFVATATAIALIVDAARMPVYFATLSQELLAAAGTIALATLGAVVGTFLGASVFHHIPEHQFHRILGGVILGLGCFMLVRAFQGA